MKKFLKIAAIIIIIIVLLLVIAFGGLFIYINFFDSEQRTIGYAQSQNTNHTIEAIYKDYGGSYDPVSGGIHVNIYLVKNGLFKTKTDITALVSDVLQCSSSMGICVVYFSDGDTSSCIGEASEKSDGTQSCISSDLEDFTIENNKLYWYGEVFDLEAIK